LTFPIAHVDIRLSIHATEDLEKAKKAVYKLLPGDHVEEIPFKTEALKGHYGNPITLFETRIKDEGTIRAFMEKLSRNLDGQDKHRILTEPDIFLEKNNLYIRLDKQAALEDEFKLRRDDPIHIRIHFKNKDKKRIMEFCRELGLTS
jgi:RNA binding exosome subunit